MRRSYRRKHSEDSEAEISEQMAVFHFDESEEFVSAKQTMSDLSMNRLVIDEKHADPKPKHPTELSNSFIQIGNFVSEEAAKQDVLEHSTKVTLDSFDLLKVIGTYIYSLGQAKELMAKSF